MMLNQPDNLKEKKIDTNLNFIPYTKSQNGSET